MPRKKKKKSEPKTSRNSADREAFDQILEEVQDLLIRENPIEALEALDRVPERYQRRGEFYHLRGLALAMVGDYISAAAEFEWAARQSPRMFPAYLNLALAYASLEYWSLAWQVAEKFLKMRKDPVYHEGERTAQAILTQAQTVVQEKSETIGISPEQYRRVGIPHERAQILLARGEYTQALKEAEEAIRLVPGWAAPHNNHALITFFLGKVEAAIAEEEQVLTNVDAENIQALGNLILFHTCLWQPEKAELYGNRLAELLTAASLEGLDLEKAIESLGILENDRALWQLAERLIDVPAEALEGFSWYILGAAAANTGHLHEAEQLLKRARNRVEVQSDWIEDALAAVRRAKRKNEPAEGTCLTGRFPYIHFRQVWPKDIVEQLMDTILEREGAEEIDRIIERHVAKYPFSAYAGKLMLWCEAEERLRRMAIDLLAAAGHPAAYAELRRFATSHYGSDDERTQALWKLGQSAQIEPEEQIRFWSSKEEEWRDIKLLMNRVEEEYVPDCHPKAAQLVDQSNQALAKGREEAKNQSKAAQLLERAVKIDPKCAIALHNLGALYLMQGREAEGEPLLHRAVEADPGYLFGYASLAGLELQRENFEGCKDYLQKIFSAPNVPANAMVQALAIQVRLAVTEGEIDSAENTLEMLKTIDPDNPQLENLEMLVHLSGVGRGWRNYWQENMHRYRERQLKKPIAADQDLATCLDRVSREALGATLRFWRLSSGGRKAEIVSRLVEAMLDPEHLAWIIREQLSEEEQAALGWVLGGGGWRSWQAFTGRYGDDFDESPYWQYHEPETLPGRLRMAGLMAVGSLDGERVALIPRELRRLLSELVPTPSIS